MPSRLAASEITDEKPNLQALERARPTQAMRPGQIERQEFEYIRHGIVNFLVLLNVYNGQMQSCCLDKNDSEHLCQALPKLLRPYRQFRRVHLIWDGGPSHISATTIHAHKAAADARHQLLNTWKTLGIPDLAQFDNESAFSGGRYARQISQVVRLCLYFGIPVLFTPLGEADYNWPAETFNALWAKQFWDRHHFSRRRDVPRVQRAFLDWYRTDYVAPRQSDTPARLRRGHGIHRLPARWADQVPAPLPICVGQIHAVRRVDEAGSVSFLNELIRIGTRYAERYVWLTLDTGQQQLTVWYQPCAEADWRQLKALDYALEETVLPVPKKFARLHL